MKLHGILVIALLLAACSRSRQPAENNRASAGSHSPTANEIATTTLSEKPAPATNDNEAAVIPPPGTGPDARTPFAEPKGAIDPKSVEAAGQVVHHYGALIEQGRWTASRDLWSSAEAAQAFERSFRAYADVHLEIGEHGEPEGAAGSIYVTEPVTFYGKKNGGGDYRRSAEVVLRRVNDVPGSTQAQRRWHIERIDWTGG